MKVVDQVMSQFVLSHAGDHGVQHWARVRVTGLTIAKKFGFDPAIFELFALFHDSKRVCEGSDPDHGTRGAALAIQFADELRYINAESFDMAVQACRLHTNTTYHPTPQIQACFDSDRLDLMRVGIMPERQFISRAVWDLENLRSNAIARGASRKLIPFISSEIAAEKTNLRLSADSLVCVHVSRGFPEGGVLRPNCCYSEERIPLLRTPRSIIECSLNGVIESDPLFSHLTAVSIFPLKDAIVQPNCNPISVWPTNVTFLGSVPLPQKTIVCYDPSICGTRERLGHGKASAVPFTRENKLSTIHKAIEAVGGTPFEIRSTEPGFQMTNWKELKSEKDYFSPHNIRATQQEFSKISSGLNIPSGSAVYNFAPTKLISRLCEFFLCFTNFGSEVWWANFAPDHAEKSLARFLQLRETARKTISDKDIGSSAWQLTDLYCDVAVFIMNTLIEFRKLDAFNLRYLSSETAPNPLAVDQLSNLGCPMRHERRREETARRARVFRRYRWSVSPSTKIYSEHPLPRILKHIVQSETDYEEVAAPHSVLELLGLWATLINRRFPDFSHNVDLHLQNLATITTYDKTL